MTEIKICKKCDREFPLKEMPSRKMEDGTIKYAGICKECKNKRQREGRKRGI